jgi:predicted metal-dependent phosphotriesterase family hydrolase
MPTRRELIVAVAGLAVSSPLRAVGQKSTAYPRPIQTVTGEIVPDRLGVTLMHEHVLVDFIGADKVSKGRYDADEAFRTILPHLQRVKTHGCQTLVECTPAYLGRDVSLLKRLSEAAGLNIISNTGYYGAANDKHLPAHAFTESSSDLATRWTREASDGIDGTSIKPGFMKIGVDNAPLSAVDEKLVRAAAMTHKTTGLPIASHTGTGAAALAELAILSELGVPGSAFIWVHAQSERDTSVHVRAAKAGAWVEFDGVSESSVARHVELVRNMQREKLLDRVLVSQDAGWYRVGEASGGQFRGFDTLFTTFVPALLAAGLTKDDVQQLLVVNPRRAFSG